MVNERRLRLEKFPPAPIILKVNSAFQLPLTVPSAAALVRAGDHAASAGDAADARVAVVVERVIRQFVSHDVIPHLPARPGGQRVDLDQAMSRVPFDNADVGPRRRLIPPERSDPGVVASEGLLERLDLADPATEVGVAFVKALAVNQVLLFDGELSAALDDVQPV